MIRAKINGRSSANKGAICSATFHKLALSGGAALALLMACVTTRSRERILCLSRFVQIERDITAQMRKKNSSAGGTRRVEPSKIFQRRNSDCARAPSVAFPVFLGFSSLSRKPTPTVQNSPNKVSKAATAPTRGSGGSRTNIV